MHGNRFTNNWIKRIRTFISLMEGRSMVGALFMLWYESNRSMVNGLTSIHIVTPKFDTFKEKQWTPTLFLTDTDTPSYRHTKSQTHSHTHTQVQDCEQLEKTKFWPQRLKMNIASAKQDKRSYSSITSWIIIFHLLKMLSKRKEDLWEI